MDGPRRRMLLVLAVFPLALASADDGLGPPEAPGCFVPGCGSTVVIIVSDDDDAVEDDDDDTGNDDDVEGNDDDSGSADDDDAANDDDAIPDDDDSADDDDSGGDDDDSGAGDDDDVTPTCPSEEFEDASLCPQWTVGPWTEDGGAYTVEGGYLEHLHVGGCADFCGKQWDVVVSRPGSFSFSSTFEVEVSKDGDVFSWRLSALSSGVVVASVGLYDDHSAHGPHLYATCDLFGGAASTALSNTYASVDSVQLIRDGSNSIEVIYNGSVRETCNWAGLVDGVRLEALEFGAYPFPTTLRTDNVLISE